MHTPAHILYMHTLIITHMCTLLTHTLISPDFSRKGTDISILVKVNTLDLVYNRLAANVT